MSNGNGGSPVALLASGTFAAASSLILPLTGVFELLRLQLSKLVMGTGGSNLLATVSDDGGSTYLATGYYWLKTTQDGTVPIPTGDTNSNDSSIKLMAGCGASVTGNGLLLDMFVPWDTGNYRQFQWKGSQRNSGSVLENISGVTMIPTVNAITHLKLAPSAGTFGGRYALRGLSGASG